MNWVIVFWLDLIGWVKVLGDGWVLLIVVGGEVLDMFEKFDVIFEEYVELFEEFFGFFEDLIEIFE